MTEEGVHAEIGQIINGEREGRQGKELIVCDLTGTAQDAAIGSYVMKALGGVSPGAKAFTYDASKPRLPAPKLYDYDTIKASVAPSKALTEAVEDAFSKLSDGKGGRAPADAHRHRRDVRRGSRRLPHQGRVHRGRSNVDGEAGQRELLQERREGLGPRGRACLWCATRPTARPRPCCTRTGT